MNKIRILIMVLIATNSFAQTNSSLGRNDIGNGSVFSSRDSTSPFVNVPCITSACTTTNTGSSLSIGAGCDPNNPGMDSAPVTDHYECTWSGSVWTFGNNINAACGNGNCSPAYLEWADQTTTRKCDGTIRNQTNDFSRCQPNGGETCTMTWNDGTTSSIPGNQAAADAGTNYVTAYASSSVAWGSVCSSEKRYCQETSPGSGVQFITGSYKYKNCVTNPPANCTSPWGTGVAHGTSVAAYQSASVNAPATCTSETRTCINGNLSGSFTNQNCTVVASSGNSCLLSGNSYSSGSAINTYSTSKIGMARICRQNTTVCTNGNWTQPDGVSSPVSLNTTPCANPIVQDYNVGKVSCSFRGFSRDVTYQAFVNTNYAGHLVNETTCDISCPSSTPYPLGLDFQPVDYQDAVASGLATDFSDFLNKYSVGVCSSVPKSLKWHRNPTWLDYQYVVPVSGSRYMGKNRYW